MNHNFKAVFFDFDGTFADTAKGIYTSVRYAAEKMNLKQPTQKELEFFVGPPLGESFSVIFELKGEDVTSAVRTYREFYVQGGMFMLEFYPGMLDFINELNRENIKIAICSNKPAKFVRRIVEHFDLTDKIDLISCPEDDNEHLTKEEMINNALSVFKLTKDEAIMVGDRYLDMEGAKKAGVTACGALYGYGTKEELLNTGADCLAESVNDVRGFVFSQA